MRVPNHPATPVRCRWDRPTCHEAPSPQPSPRGRGGRRLGATNSPHPHPLPEGEGVGLGPGRYKQDQPPLPLGEGGRRPGEGPQSPCYIRPLPLGPAHLPRGTLTPTLSQRERGSEAGPGRYKQDQPLSLRERVAEGRVRVPNHPATPVRCRWDRPTCHEVPSPQPSPRGRGGRRLGPGRYKQDQPPLPPGEGGRRPGEGPQSPCYTRPMPLGPAYLPRGHPHPNPLPEGEGVGGWGQGATNKTNPLSLWERVAEGRVRVPNHPATSVRCRWDRPTCPRHPHPDPLPEGEGGRLGPGRYKQDQPPLPLGEGVGGRVRVPNHPATPVRCRWDRPTCHEVPSPQPSPRGRGVGG